jgi:hypothetical protein
MQSSIGAVLHEVVRFVPIPDRQTGGVGGAQSGSLEYARPTTGTFRMSL